MRRRIALVIALLVLLVPAIAGAADGSFQSYQARGWGWMFLASFGFGFLTSLTPCVYPMIPITLAIFGARGEKVSKGRALALATAYVGGMGLTYAVLGVAVALLGDATNFGQQLGSAWLVFPLVALFVALALSMFGLYELNLPSGLQNRLARVGGKGFGGAFAMGLVGGLIAAPCTGPFLAGLLAFVSTTGSVVGGGALLFTYAIGMGVLFWILAAFALALPKSGKWMDGVKSGGGAALLFAAIYFLKPFLPFIKHLANPAYWFLGAAIAVAVAGIVVGAIGLSFHGSWTEKTRKAVGLAMLLAGAVGVWMWWMAPKRHLPWTGDEKAAFARARAEHKGVLVDFAAEWCNPCQEMERTFGDDDVYGAITADFVPLQFDVTSSSDENFERRKRYDADTLPAVLFLAPDGTVLARVSKMTEPDELMRIVGPAVKKLHGGA
ncbi:MAG TPA: cytochrome c biogenesis protein CcdA [Kofleriaceae bacterium]|nr:cytochrome c biogenesis protein CcdA [Kofleriaceae bacterium]